MADINIGSITIPVPLNYILEPIKLENRTRALDGTMLVTYAVTTGDTAVTKYHFEIPGIIKSERKTIRVEAQKTGNLGYIDHLIIPEIAVHKGSTSSGSVSLQRELGSASSTDITGTLAGVTKTFTVSAGTTPGSTEVFVTTGGALTVGSTSTGNLIIDYIPNYSVHIISDSHELLQKSSTGGHIVRYRLICEEV